MAKTGWKSLWEVNTDRLLLWNKLFFQLSLGMHECRILRPTSRLRNLGCVCTAINLCRRLCRGSGVNFILPRTGSPASTAGQHSTGVRTCCQGMHLTFQTGFCSSFFPVPLQLHLPDTSRTWPGYRCTTVQCQQHREAVRIRGSSCHQRRAARKSLTPVISFLYRRGCLWQSWNNYKGCQAALLQRNVSLGEHKDGGEEMKVVYTQALSQTRILQKAARPSLPV